MPIAARKYVLDAGCFVDAARDANAEAALTTFCAAAAPRLYLSAVVAAELRAIALGERERRVLDRAVFEPYERRHRVLTPSAAAWQAVGVTLATLAREGLRPRQLSRSFAFDIALAYSCRETGAVLVSRDVEVMQRIARVFSFEFVFPYPIPMAPSSKTQPWFTESRHRS